MSHARCSACPCTNASDEDAPESTRIEHMALGGVGDAYANLHLHSKARQAEAQS